MTADGRDYGPECFQRLQSAFETDRAWQQAVLRRSLSHDRADEIVGQDVSPDLLSNEFGGLANMNATFVKFEEVAPVAFSKICFSQRFVEPGSSRLPQLVPAAAPRSDYK